MLTKNTCAFVILPSARFLHVSVRLWNPTLSQRESIDSAKSKIVHFIRHGQGYHNFIDGIAKEAGAIISDVDDYDVAVQENRFYIKPQLQDPPLTAEGYADAKKLQVLVANSNKQFFNPKLFIVSPLRRATQTALFGFNRYISQKEKDEKMEIAVIALESCREQCGIYYSDKRSDVCDISIEFPRVNYEHINSNEDIMWKKHSRESATEMLSRQEEFLSFIRSRTEADEMVVVTHSGWLSVLTNCMLTIEEPGQSESIQSMFATGEMRSLLLTWRD